MTRHLYQHQIVHYRRLLDRIDSAAGALTCQPVNTKKAELARLSSLRYRAWIHFERFCWANKHLDSTGVYRG